MTWVGIYQNYVLVIFKRKSWNSKPNYLKKNQSLKLFKILVCADSEAPFDVFSTTSLSHNLVKINCTTSRCLYSYNSYMYALLPCLILDVKCLLSELNWRNYSIIIVYAKRVDLIWKMIFYRDLNASSFYYAVYRFDFYDFNTHFPRNNKRREINKLKIHLQPHNFIELSVLSVL